MNSAAKLCKTPHFPSLETGKLFPIPANSWFKTPRPIRDLATNHNFPNLFCSIKRIPSVSPSNIYSLKRHKARYLCEPYMCLINQLTKIMKFISNIKFNSNFNFWWCKGCSACLSEGKGKTVFGRFQRFAMNLLRVVATEWRVCDKGENRVEILSQTN